MAENDENFVTQDEIATQLGADVIRIRPIVNTLAALGQIKTMRSWKDRRYLLVHKDAIPVIKQALINAP